MCSQSKKKITDTYQSECKINIGGGITVKTQPDM